MLKALVEQITQGRDTQSEHVGDHVGFDQLGRVAGEHHGDLGPGRPGTVDRQVKWNACPRRILGTRRRHDQQTRHECQYAPSFKAAG